jgi:hypothetical protein
LTTKPFACEIWGWKIILFILFGVFLAKLIKQDSPGAAAGQSQEEMESRLFGNILVSESELADLAEERGRKVQSWLTEKGIPSERVFLLAPKIEPGKTENSGNRVQFSLR